MAEKNLLVMLIEDDQEDTMLFQEALTEISPKIELVSFSNWKHAGDFLEATNIKPDIIFIDYLLPGKSGSDFAKELRSKNQLQDTPIILLSGMAKHLTSDSVIVNEVIPKPSNFNQLLESIKKSVQNYIPEMQF